MEKLLTELGKIYEKLGGQSSDIPQDRKSDLEFIVDKIEDKVGEGGGSGGGVFKVNANENDELDKNFEEILSAFNSGSLPVLISDYDGMIVVDPFVGYVDAGPYAVHFYDGLNARSISAQADSSTGTLVINYNL